MCVCRETGKSWFRNHQLCPSLPQTLNDVKLQDNSENNGVQGYPFLVLFQTTRPLQLGREVHTSSPCGTEPEDTGKEPKHAKWLQFISNEHISLQVSTKQSLPSSLQRYETEQKPRNQPRTDVKTSGY